MTAAGVVETGNASDANSEEDDQIPATTETSKAAVKLARVNGWNCPLHPLQVVAWLAILYMAIYYYLTAVPSLVTHWQYAAYIVVGVSTIIHLICLVTCTSINAADHAVLKKMKHGDRSVRPFNRTIHGHVIVNQHCNICGLDVSTTSKHCRTCDKCVDKFDHHCVWLNNCIGAKNYRVFIAMLATAVITLLLIFIVLTTEWVAYYTDKDNGDILIFYQEALESSETNEVGYGFRMEDCTQNRVELLSLSASCNTTTASTSPSVNVEPQFRVFYIDVPSGVWLAFLILTEVICVLGLVLLTHLFFFHLYLLHKGLTTFEYINFKSEREEMAAREKSQQTEVEYQTKARRANQVAPGEAVYLGNYTGRSTTYEYQSDCGATDVDIETGQTETSGNYLRSSEGTDTLQHSLWPSSAAIAMTNNTPRRTSEGITPRSSSRPTTTCSSRRPPSALQHREQILINNGDLPEVHYRSSQTHMARSKHGKRHRKRQKQKANTAIPTGAVSSFEHVEEQLNISQAYIPNSSSCVMAAGPVADYDSESAGDLQEIPVSKTQAGVMHSTMPKTCHLPPQVTSTRNSSSGAFDNNTLQGSQSKKELDKLEGGNNYADSHGSCKDTPGEFTTKSKRHHDVPPLDLGSINHVNSDDDFDDESLS